MGRKYYILWYRLDGGDSYLIWYSDETDGVFVEEDGYVPSFKRTGSLVEYVRRRNLSVDAEGLILLNLDIVGKWLEEKDADLIDPYSFNGAWNLFADVSSSTGGAFDSDQGLTRKIYENCSGAVTCRV